jgi:KaiC/GvpD/RAD55 family RecA-like ATPase
MSNQVKPFILMVVGVNGVGKTTTIGKMANQFVKNGNKVLLVATANSGPVFKANDILAIIGIESSWNPKAKSKDGAYGLTQIIPKYWKVDHKVETQIETTYKILNEYYNELKDKNKTIIAYNCGLTNFKQGKCGKRYLNKFNRELKEITENDQV